MSGPDHEGSTDFPPDDGHDNGRKVDAVTDVTAASVAFNNAALPPDMPEWLKDDLRSKAAEIVQAMQEGDLRLAALQLREDEAYETQTSMWQAVAAREQREREDAHEREWLETRHAYAGQTMDGKDWRAMMDWFRDEGNVASWEDAMVAETGQSRDEVRHTGGKMKRFYDLMEKDARGTLGKDERAEFETLQADREVRRGVEVQKEIQGLRLGNDASVTARNEEALDGKQSVRTTSFAMIFEDDSDPASGLAKVTPLSAIYREAAAGEKAVSPIARPALSPAQTVTVSPDNMFG